MQIASAIAIYALFWVMSAFVVMPFGIRTHDEMGASKVAGQADSAPANFRPGRVAIRATILAAVLFGIFYVNYVEGWITRDDLNFMPAPPDIRAEQI